MGFRFLQKSMIRNDLEQSKRINAVTDDQKVIGRELNVWLMLVQLTYLFWSEVRQKTAILTWSWRDNRL